MCGDGIDKYGLLATRCDDGNNVPLDGCDPLCFLENGFANNGVKIYEVCGDGFKKTDQCDDGNPFSTDGCTSACKIETGF